MTVVVGPVAHADGHAWYPVAGAEGVLVYALSPIISCPDYKFWKIVQWAIAGLAVGQFARVDDYPDNPLFGSRWLVRRKRENS